MNVPALSYLALGAAILCEVVGTSFLQKSEQFSKLAPTAIMAVFYILSFWLLSVALKSLPLGIAYAIWGGLGIVLTAVVGTVVFRQQLDAMAIVGIGMIVGGVVVINVFSSSSH